MQQIVVSNCDSWASHSRSMPPASALLGVVIEVAYELRISRRRLATSYCIRMTGLREVLKDY
jgi:hypothetical protein